MGSTGNIMLSLADAARKKGHTVFTYSPYDYSKKYRKMPPPPDGHRYYGTFFERWIHNAVGRIFGCNGLLSVRGTRQLVRQLKKNETEIVHLHNLHSYCINFPVLMRYVRKNDIKLVWTLHDCWTFTGHCPHFEAVGCDRWKTGCHSCPQYREYPQSLIDNSAYMYRLKKKWFGSMEKLITVTPSRWLAERVEESFLGVHTVSVINNGVDTEIFTPAASDFRSRYGCEDKYIVLGAAYSWSRRKGLDVFIRLASMLGEKYRIVLVGTGENTDKFLPENIISVHRINDPLEMAKLYSAADVFVNPTLEDTYPSVNLEALACGTPVLTFESGGSAECIDAMCGSAVAKNDIDALAAEIVRITEKKTYASQSCVRRASELGKEAFFEKYLRLYEELE